MSQIAHACPPLPFPLPLSNLLPTCLFLHPRSHPRKNDFPSSRLHSSCSQLGSSFFPSLHQLPPSPFLSLCCFVFFSWSPGAEIQALPLLGELFVFSQSLLAFLFSHSPLSLSFLVLSSQLAVLAPCLVPPYFCRSLDEAHMLLAVFFISFSKDMDGRQGPANARHGLYH